MSMGFIGNQGSSNSDVRKKAVAEVLNLQGPSTYLYKKDIDAYNKAYRASNIANLQNSITGLMNDIASDKAQIVTNNAQIDKDKLIIKQYPGTLAAQDAATEIRILEQKNKDLHADIAAKRKQVAALNAQLGGDSFIKKALRNKGGNGPGKNSKGTLPENQSQAMEYNVSSVNEAYFTTRPEFLLELKNQKQLGSLVQGDKPGRAIEDSALAELWANGKSSKGMITTWTQSDSYYVDSTTGQIMALQSATTSSGQSSQKVIAFPPQGFRFQYNPGSISMSYSGTPLVDPNFEASGKDKFNLAGTGVTQSTITFQLLINRMYDMKYFWREGELDSAGQATTPGTLKEGAEGAYGTETVDAKTQQAIYNMGTMYDIEFLLRAIMGYSMKSYLRDYSFFKDGGTADMGYIGARPVELHLGKNLRYLVYITGIGVEHAIFDSRMVPIFTNISIQCSRLPDYQSAKAWDQASKQNLSGTSTSSTGASK